MWGKKKKDTTYNLIRIGIREQEWKQNIYVFYLNRAG